MLLLLFLSSLLLLVFFFSFSFQDWLAPSILGPPGVYRPAAVAVMFVCHHTWPESVMCWVLDQTWLTDCCSCCLFPLTALSAPSTQLFCPPRSIPKLCQRMLHSTPPSVIGLLCWEPPDLIRKGIWTPSCPLLSSPLLLTPPLPLLSTSPWPPRLRRPRWSSPRASPSLAPGWLVSPGRKVIASPFPPSWRCPTPSNVKPFPLWLLFLAGLRQESTSRSTADEGEAAGVPLGRQEGEEVQHFLFPPQCKQRTAEAACPGRYAPPLTGEGAISCFFDCGSSAFPPLRQ